MLHLVKRVEEQFGFFQCADSSHERDNSVVSGRVGGRGVVLCFFFFFVLARQVIALLTSSRPLARWRQRATWLFILWAGCVAALLRVFPATKHLPDLPAGTFLRSGSSASQSSAVTVFSSSFSYLFDVWVGMDPAPSSPPSRTKNKYGVWIVVQFSFFLREEGDFSLGGRGEGGGVVTPHISLSPHLPKTPTHLRHPPKFQVHFLQKSPPKQIEGPPVKVMGLTVN